MSSFGWALRVFREAGRWRQGSLAIAAGMKVDRLSKIERAEIQPTPPDLAKLVVVLGADVIAAVHDLAAEDPEDEVAAAVAVYRALRAGRLPRGGIYE